MNTTAVRPLTWTVVAVLAWVALVFVAISLGARPSAAQSQSMEEGAVVHLGKCTT